MKIIKCILIIFVFMVLTFTYCLNYSVYATTSVRLNPEYTQNSIRIKSFGQDVFGAIRNFAIISSVVLLAYCGLRIVFGSIEQRAEYKKTLVPIIIGALVVLFATTIVSMVQKLSF